MLTAGQAFSGETVVDTLSAILNRDADWRLLPSETPSAVRRLLHRCLAKDLKRRIHDISDARIEIEDALDAGGDTLEAEQRGLGIGARTAALLAAALLGLGMVAGALFTRSGPSIEASSPQIVRYTIPVDGLAASADPAVSRDGRYIAFIASKGTGRAQSGSRLSTRTSHGSCRGHRGVVAVLVAGWELTRVLCGWRTETDRAVRGPGAAHRQSRRLFRRRVELDRRHCVFRAVHPLSGPGQWRHTRSRRESQSVPAGEFPSLSGVPARRAALPVYRAERPS